MEPVQILPHLNAFFNVVVTLLLVAGFVAIRKGNRRLHPRIMISAVLTGIIFICCYGLQVYLVGHQRFPGDDWVRSVFLLILGTHTFLAVLAVPLIITVLVLARTERFTTHRRLARITFPIWLYVSITGVIIYWMNNHLRPPL